MACRLFATYIRLRQRDMKKYARQDREFRLILAQQERLQMFEAAMQKVYGSDL